MVTVELELAYAKERAKERLAEAKLEWRRATELGDEMANELGEDSFDALVAEMMRITLERHGTVEDAGSVARLQLRIRACVDIIATCEHILRPEVVRVLGGGALLACLDTPVAVQLQWLSTPGRSSAH